MDLFSGSDQEIRLLGFEASPPHVLLEDDNETELGIIHPILEDIIQTVVSDKNEVHQFDKIELGIIHPILEEIIQTVVSPNDAEKTVEKSKSGTEKTIESSESRKERRKSEGSNCCVAFCSNRDVKDKGRVHFYRVVRSRNQEQSDLWIKILKKHNGDSWQASKSSKICGDHFVSGEFNSSENHPDYVPTIFPKNESIKRATKSDVERAERVMQRAQMKNVSSDVKICNDPCNDPDPPTSSQPPRPRFKDQGTWTEYAEKERPKAQPKPVKEFNHITKQVSLHLKS